METIHDVQEKIQIAKVISRKHPLNLPLVRHEAHNI
jgi:hypothetical protein